ncbi:hypothetical protein MRS44_010553 [Fusarium solani]|uniref:uncharacterized protein n=1 Tax=Fusarium solani TaxID=169388 RepID=UPI0032C41616|nr:hypothetical protein MRS44_010553 [Fusarium solani]
MSSQPVSSNTTSGSPCKGDTTSVLGPFVYDTSLLGDSLIQRTITASTGTTTTKPATKDKPSNGIDVEVFEESGEATVEL